MEEKDEQQRSIDKTAEQAANAALRERFLHFLNWASDKQIEVKMFNDGFNPPLNGTLTAVDAVKFEHILINKLQTPVGVVEHAALRTRDTLWLQMDCPKKVDEEMAGKSETGMAEKKQSEEEEEGRKTEENQPGKDEGENIVRDEVEKETIECVVREELCLDNIFKPWEEEKPRGDDEKQEEEDVDNEQETTRDISFTTAPSTPIPPALAGRQHHSDDVVVNSTASSPGPRSNGKQTEMDKSSTRSNCAPNSSSCSTPTRDKKHKGAGGGRMSVGTRVKQFLSGDHFFNQFG